MSEVLFKKVDFDVNYLISAIDSGKIGLPDMQRPFVWAHTKVQTLFDSMYKGYPIGNLLLWEAPDNEEGKLIGSEGHGADNPSTLIIDGQQRLTSLYAVMMKKPVIDKNFKERHIKIAFNCLTSEFAVKSAAHEKSSEWISDISDVFVKSESVRKITNNKIKEINKGRELQLTEEEEETISDNIEALLALKKYPFSALEIGSEADEESVADIFVRINGQGQRLNQADFILTMISVVWNEGRNEIEKFCKDGKTPSTGKPTAYNSLVEPDPVHIIRATMSYGFDRGRLSYAYMLLRGRDFETRKYKPDLQEERFKKFKEVLYDVINIQHWQDFLKCVLSAGYVNKQMITSDTTVMYCYSMYLIGKLKYKVNEYDLRLAIARWFTMCQLTSRYVGSFESQMEEDLANLRVVKNDIQFLDYLRNVIKSQLTSDFWTINLPNNLNTSSAQSPFWSSYIAALHMLQAKVLFSNLTINSLTEASKGNKSSLERHHLFPKAYLKSIGISNDRDRNQNANYAYVEWKDNIEISDIKPSEYIDSYISRYNQDELSNIYKFHGLYVGWENDNYFDFLEKRRSKIAEIIQEGFNKI